MNNKKRNNKILLLLAALLLWLQPVSEAMTVTSPFGWRVHPISGKRTFHSGVDLAGESGAPIPALFDGDVALAETYGGYGNAVVLRHAGDRYTLYGHCSRLLVAVGQHVEAGEPIALVGSTGNSTGPHVHLEYWVNGEYVDPLQLWADGMQP